MTKLRWLGALVLAVPFFAQGSWARPLSEEPSRVIYQVYVRAFYDGSVTPDGEGDFAGLDRKGGYLKDLGVDTLLLMPVFQSTGGMGYIPRDYFQLETAYGNQAEFQHLLTAMHAHGIKVILDAPVNHISYDSAWFRRGSQKNCDPADTAHDPDDPDNQYCDYFYFSANPGSEWPYRNWHKPWKWNETDYRAVWFQRPDFNAAYHRPEFFYATFFNAMPDLKFWSFEHDGWNTKVVARVQDFFNYWARLGVDGFRIDAAKHFVEGGDRNNNPQEPQNKELLAKFLAGVREVNPDISFIGEIWSGHDEFEPYLPRSLDMVLDFPFMEAVRSSVGDNFGERFKGVLKHFEATQRDIKPGARVVFAGNHDVSRMMSEWNDDEAKWRLAHFLTFMTPFTPLLYYGEELGMHGRVKRPDATSDDEWVRTVYAFPWDGEDISVGFPGGEDPVAGIPDNYRERNLVAALLDGGSTLHLVRDLLAIRRRFGVTTDTRLVVRNDLYGHVIGWTMVQDRRCLTVLTNFNLHDSYEIEAKHADPSACTARRGRPSIYREVLAEQAERRERDGKVFYLLKPYAKVVVLD